MALGLLILVAVVGTMFAVSNNKDTQRGLAAGPSVGIGAHLVLDADPSVRIEHGLRPTTMERSLADQVKDQLESEAWWPLVGVLEVEEDLLISDVRIGLDVLYHPEAFEGAMTICNAVLKALPATDSGLLLEVRPTSMLGGDRAIDGSVEPWDPGYVYGTAFASAGDASCSQSSIVESAVQKTSQYLGDS